LLAVPLALTASVCFQSWGGAIGNYFKGKPKQEASGVYSETKSGKGDAKAREPLPCPKSVLRGKALVDAKIRQQLEAKRVQGTAGEGKGHKIHSFAEGEHVMYFASNAGVFGKDRVANCVVVTNIRAFQVTKGVRGECVGLGGIRTATHSRVGLMSHDRVELELWNKNKRTLELWDRSAALFFADLLNRVKRKIASWSTAEATRVLGRREGRQQGQKASGNKIDDLIAAHDDRFDQQLDVLSGVLNQVAAKADMISTEIADSNRMLGHIHRRVGDTDARTKAANRRGKNML